MPLTAEKPPTAGGHTPRRRSGYMPPRDRHTYPFADLLLRIGRAALEERQMTFLRDASSGREAAVFYAGELDLLDAPTVSIVGTRDVSDAGWKRASQLARELAKSGVTIVSGLAKGVDTAALTSAISNGGRVAAVIGTPLDKAYPAENSELQQEIYAHHLLMSPFKEGDRVFKSNFPVRNRVMAAVSDATVIIEASDTSGTLHQAAECVSLGGLPRTAFSRFLLDPIEHERRRDLKFSAAVFGYPFSQIESFEARRRSGNDMRVWTTTAV